MSVLKVFIGTWIGWNALCFTYKKVRLIYIFLVTEMVLWMGAYG